MRTPSGASAATLLVGCLLCSVLGRSFLQGITSEALAPAPEAVAMSPLNTANFMSNLSCSSVAKPLYDEESEANSTSAALSLSADELEAVDRAAFKFEELLSYMSGGPSSFWYRSRFKSRAEVLEELQNPSENYTVLLPTATSLQKLQDYAFNQPAGFDERLLDSLLLHIVRGRHTVEDIFANQGGQLETIHGRLLQLDRKQFALDGNVTVQVSYRNSTASIPPRDPTADFYPAIESCKPQSVIVPLTLHGTGILLEEHVYEALYPKTSDRGLVAPNHYNYATTPQSAEQNEDKNAQAPLAMLILPFILLAVVISVMCLCLGSWMHTQRAAAEDDHHPFAHADDILAASRGLWDAPEAISNAPSAPPPTVLQRMATQRWTTELSAKTNSLTDGAALQCMSGGVALQKTGSVENKLSRSNDVDTQGLRKDTACVICMEREGDHVLIPCGHGGHCGPCARTLLSHAEPNPTSVCPVCRAEITSVVQVHLSTPIGAQGDVLDSVVLEEDAAVEASSASPQERHPPARVQFSVGVF